MAARPAVRVGLQAWTGIGMALLAALITAVAHPSPAFGAWRAGPPWNEQLTLAGWVAGLALVSLVGLLVLVRTARGGALLRSAVPGSWRALCFRPAGALVIALSAGIGEELLFRAALQPLLGVLGATLLFTLAHAKTARLSGTRAKQVLYLMQVFLAGLFLAVVYEVWGLLPAIALHTAIDLLPLMALGMLQADAPG